MITYSILASVMQYIGIIVLLYIAFLVYAIIRRVRDEDKIPLDIAKGIFGFAGLTYLFGMKWGIIAIIGTVIMIAIDADEWKKKHKKDNSHNN